MPDLAEPPAHTSADTFAAFTEGLTQTDTGLPQDQQQAAPAPSPTPTAKAPAAEPPKAAPTDTIPDELLRGSKPDQIDHAQEFEKLITEKPTGQIKHEHFAKVQEGAKAEVARIRAELETARKELEQRKSSPVPEEHQERFKTVSEALEKANAELERTAYERSPKFREKFTERENALRESVKTIGKDYSLDDDTVSTILNASGKRRDELVDGLDISEGAKRRLDAHLSSLDVLARDREADLGKAREANREQEMQAQEKEKAEQVRTQVELKKIGVEIMDLAKTKLSGFQPIDGNPAWNAEVQARQAAFEDALMGRGVTVAEKAEAYALALDHPVQVHINERLRARLKEEMDKNAKLTAAVPNGGQAPSPAPGEGGKHSPGDTFTRFTQQAENNPGAFNFGQQP